MNSTNIKMAEIVVAYRPQKSQHPLIRTSQEAYDCLYKFFSETDIALQEKFVVGYLNRSNKLLGVYSMSKGGIAGTIADPKLILGVALKSAASGIILAHNHPSGNLQPSAQDRELTAKINEACKLFDIILLDHLIISPDEKYFSFADNGLL